MSITPESDQNSKLPYRVIVVPAMSMCPHCETPIDVKLWEESLTGWGGD